MNTDETTETPDGPSRERPLVLTGTRTVVTVGPSPRRPLAKALLFLVRRIPTYRDTRSGRQRARTARTMGVVAGLTIALLGQSLHTAMLGVIVLIVVPALPIPEARRLRWVTSLERRQRGREQRAEAPVELLFDGGRVQVRAEGRIAQTVDASERQLGTVDGRACLRFGSGKRLAVVCAGETPAEVDPGAPLDASSADRVVLPTSGWAALHEAVIAPERKRQRRQELRDRRRAEKERRQRPK